MIPSPFSAWLKRHMQLAKQRAARMASDARRGKLTLEALEDRTLLAATVTGVTTTLTPNSIVGAGQTVNVEVDFSEAVNVTGTPELTLNDSAGTTATFDSGSSSPTALIFSFNVPTSDTTSGAALDYTSTSSLNLNSGAITDVGDGFAADLTLPTPGGSDANDHLFSDDIQIDGVAPTVTSVSTTNSSGTTLGTGQTVTIDLNLSKAVTVDTSSGTPILILSDGKAAIYSGPTGTSTSTLAFTYTVGSGDTTNGAALDYTAGGLVLNNGRIVDSAGNSLDLTLPTPGVSDPTNDLLYSADLVIDATTPTVTSVTTPTVGGTYGTGTNIAFDVTFSENVTVTGSPTLTLSNGKTVTLTGGSGNTLVFTYVVASGDTTNGTALDVSSLSLSGGTIKNAGGEDANLTINGDGVATGKSIVIDATTPTVTGLTATPGTYGPGATINIDVQFSENVTVTGTPTLTLSDGKTAVYTSGSGSNTLVFSYVVASGDTTNGAALDESSTSALSGTIKNAGGVSASLTLPAPGAAGSLSQSNVVIDGTTPSVLIVDSTTTAGTYGTGSTVKITVLFSENVTVTGTPTLTLSDGRTAVYTSGSGTTTLTFTYTVQAGDTTNGQPLDYASSTALNLNGGAIKSAGGTAAVLTLPAPGGVNDMLATKGIVINAPPPVPSPSPTSSLQAQVQQIVQDLVLLEIQAATGDVPAFFRTLHDFQSLLPAVEQELFQIFLNGVVQALGQAQQMVTSTQFPG